MADQLGKLASGHSIPPLGRINRIFESRYRQVTFFELWKQESFHARFHAFTVPTSKIKSTPPANSHIGYGDILDPKPLHAQAKAGER